MFSLTEHSKNNVFKEILVLFVIGSALGASLLGITNFFNNNIIYNFQAVMCITG